MRTPSQLVIFFLAAILVACTSAPKEQPPASSDAPVIVIRQYPDYPMPGRDSEFPGGLVAALWRNGRVIRPATRDAVGKTYVEGTVAAQQREEFFTFLSTAVVRAAKSEGIPVHVASQSITIRSNGISKWTRVLPDTASVWREVESRLLALPIQNGRTVDLAAVRNSGWYE